MNNGGHCPILRDHPIVIPPFVSKCELSVFIQVALHPITPFRVMPVNEISSVVLNVFILSIASFSDAKYFVYIKKLFLVARIPLETTIILAMLPPPIKTSYAYTRGSERPANGPIGQVS